MKLARLFSYTRQLEQELSAAQRSRLDEIALRKCIEENHHAEFEELRRDIAAANEAKAAAESRAQVLQAERERQDVWLHKLSDQNFELTDRLLLKAGSVPTHEPLRSEPPAADDSKRDELLDMSVRRTGPVAAARERALEEQRQREAKEFEARRKVPAPTAIAEAASNEGVEDVMQT